MSEKMTERLQFRLTPTMRKTLEQVAAGRGVTLQHVAREAFAKYTSECHCDGRGIIGWHAGNWVYCVCRLGISCAMADLNNTILMFADDLATMPEVESNQEQRELKQGHYDMMLLEYDSLQTEWERLRDTQQDALTQF